MIVEPGAARLAVGYRAMRLVVAVHAECGF